MHRLKQFLSTWQDGLLWLPITIGLLLLATFLLPRFDPLAAVDGLGFLQGYAILLMKGVVITFSAWLCKRTYTRDLTDEEEMALLEQPIAQAIDRLEWLMWLGFWYFVLSG